MNPLPETQRLLLRETIKKTAEQIPEDAEKDDMAAFLEALPEEEVQAAIADSDGILSYLRTLHSICSAENGKHFAAWDRDGTLIAYAGVSGWDTSTPELQIKVAAAFQGQGFGTEFLRALVPWLFQSGGFRCLVYHLRTDNAPSEKLIQRLGGVLQTPKSKIEELTLKTYFLYPAASR